MATSRAARRPAAAQTAVPRVTYLVGRLNRALHRRLIDALRPFKLAVAQYTTLSVLHTRGFLSNAQLAKRALISPQAMNEVIQGLEARKLVTRRPSTSHGRIVQLLLTQRGLDVMHECDAAVSQLERSMLAGLTALEGNKLRVALATCTQTLEHHDPKAPRLPARARGVRHDRELESAQSST